MCNLTTNFNFDNNQVRTLLINNKPYFVGYDVAEALGYSKPRNAISRPYRWRKTGDASYT